LTKDEAEARHDAGGIKRSYFEDGLSYAMLDMCKGRFGYEFSISLEDGLYTLCDQSCTRNAAKTYFRRALKPKKSLRDSLLADIAKAWGELRLSLSSSDLRKAKSVGLEKIRENVLSVAMSSGLDIREIIVSELMK
jgi:hypothetical protein